MQELNVQTGNLWGVDFYFQPAPILAMAVTALNDHYLKINYPSAVTGKISDFCGLFFTPLFLCALACIASHIFGERAEGLRRSWLLAAISVTYGAFALINLSQTAADFYIFLMAGLGYPSQVTMDRTDLWALLTAPVVYAYGMQFCRQNCRTQSLLTKIVQTNSPLSKQLNTNSAALDSESP